jgi:hypothetical protein
MLLPASHSYIQDGTQFGTHDSKVPLRVSSLATREAKGVLLSLPCRSISTTSEQSMRSRSIFLRGLAVGGFLLGASLLAPPVAQSKEFLLEAILDCGTASGRACDIGDVITIRERFKGGLGDAIMVDISWIRSQVTRQKQDDLICIEVATRPDGILQGLGISESCDNPGPRRDSKPDDGEADDRRNDDSTEPK